MRRLPLIKWIAIGIGCLAILAGPGCANFSLPRIDPSGERLFLPANAPPPVTSPVVPSFPTYPAPTFPTVPTIPTTPQPLPTTPIQVLPSSGIGAGPGQPGVSIHPSRIVAPVGSEVVMLANACGGDGYLVTGERIEWTLSQGGVGHFVEPGQREPFDITSLFTGLPRKVDSRLAVNRTLSGQMQIHRGTPSPLDDITVLPGQAWITVTSPTEGTSHVSAYGPDVEGWDRRQQSATIHWVDVLASFPPPGISAAGTRRPLTTLLTRQSNGTPVANYRVRYEVTGGPAAGFAPDGSPVVEVASNEAGQATAEIMQTQPGSGTNQVAIQVFRPEGLTPGGGERLLVASGSTLQTWTSSDLQIRVTGPQQAAPGATVTFRIEVSNPGAVAAQNVIVTDEPPAGLNFLNSNPAANTSPSGQEWQLGELGPSQTRVIEANYRVAAGGTLNLCASATAEGNLTARGCASVSSVTPALEVTISGPDAAAVGQTVPYEIRVTNTSAQPISGLVITNRFDPGLEHAQAASPIERDLPELPPGAHRRIAVQFKVTQAGTLCQTVDVVGAGGIRGNARHCLIATVDQPGPVQPSPVQPGPVQPGPVDPGATQPGAEQPGPVGGDAGTGGASQPDLTVTVQAPPRRRVGQVAEFVMEVTNTGNVPLTNVRLTAEFEQSLEPGQATAEWKQSGSSLYWTVESLPPGRKMVRQINFNCLQVAERACVQVNVTNAEGVTKDEQGCLEIQVAEEGTPPATGGAGADGRLSLSVADQVDPVAIGAETTYQVTITNGTNQPERNVVLAVNVPDELQFKGASGPVQGAIAPRRITFTPIAELRAGETLSFSLKFAGSQAGTARLHTEVTSARQTQPISADETTEVVGAE